MRNIKTSLKGSILTIEVDLAKAGQPSGSGKSIVLGSTEGNVDLSDLGKAADGVKLGVNCYRKKADE